MASAQLTFRLSARRPPVVQSYGGGLNSFADLIDSVQRGDKPDVCVFIDVADPEHEDPGEWPGTYRHMEEVARPFAEAHGIEWVTIDSRAYPIRDARSLFAWMGARGQIPVAGPNRICTRIAKVERFEAWLADRFPGERVEVRIGFEAGEEDRVAKDPNVGKSVQRVNRFRLIERGLCRCRCEQLVRAAGFAVPRKSACTFCPYGSRGDWKTFAAASPVHFGRTVALEAQKPPTKKNGIKLSIMGFRTIKNSDGTKRHVAPMLPTFISKPYRPRPAPCAVCGAPERASKAAGCDYLEAA